MSRTPRHAREREREREARPAPLLATAVLLAGGLLPDGGGGAAGSVRGWLATLRDPSLNRADTERMERGYYEALLDGPRRFGPGGSAGRARERDRDHEGAPRTPDHERLTRPVPDVREFVLRPGLTLDPTRGIPWATNAHGLRDRAYPVAKAPGTLRVALVGDSIAAGWRVPDGLGFEPRLERLWDARSRAAGGPRVEVLNFAVPGHGPGQRWTHFDRVGWSFAPDLVLFEATPADAGWDERRLRGLLARGVGFDAPVYREALAGAGVRPGSDAESYRRRLRPLRDALLAGVYREAAAACHARGVACAWVLIPRVGKPADPVERARLAALARSSGFDAVIDVSDAYDGADPAALAVAPDDFHPNAEGHARIARALDARAGGWPALAALAGKLRGASLARGSTDAPRDDAVGRAGRTTGPARAGDATGAAHGRARPGGTEGAEPR